MGFVFCPHEAIGRAIPYETVLLWENVLKKKKPAERDSDGDCCALDGLQVKPCYVDSRSRARSSGGYPPLKIFVEFHAESEVHLVKNLLDFHERLAAEVSGLEHVRFGMLYEFGIIRKLTIASESAKMIVVDSLTNYHYGHIDQTNAGNLFPQGYI